jgi:hypothetical protein
MRYSLYNVKHLNKMKQMTCLTAEEYDLLRDWKSRLRSAGFSLWYCTATARGRVLLGKKNCLYAADNVCKITHGISDNKCCVVAPPFFTLYKLTLYRATITYWVAVWSFVILRAFIWLQSHDVDGRMTKRGKSGTRETFRMRWHFKSFLLVEISQTK